MSISRGHHRASPTDDHALKVVRPRRVAAPLPSFPFPFILSTQMAPRPEPLCHFNDRYESKLLTEKGHRSLNHAPITDFILPHFPTRLPNHSYSIALRHSGTHLPE